MGNGKNAKRVEVGECVKNHVCQPWKWWIDSLNDWLKNRGLDVGHPKRMVHDRSEWQEFLGGNAWGVACGMNY